METEDLIDYKRISKKKTLDEKLIDENWQKLHHNHIFKYQSLSIRFIKSKLKDLNKTNWKSIALYQSHLNYDFVKENKKNLKLDYLKNNGYLMEKRSNSIPILRLYSDELNIENILIDFPMVGIHDLEEFVPDWSKVNLLLTIINILWIS